MLSADSSYRDTENDTLELDGHVQIIYSDQHLRADRVKVNLRSKSLDAIGNVNITSPKSLIVGQRITLDYETNSGLIYDGYVQSGSVLFEGLLLHKNGETEYLAIDSRYTTCDNCPESWAFSGTKIRAELGGYAYIKNSVLRVGGVPIFWLPYLVVPLKSDRQSGLLPPEFEKSDLGGLAIGQSAFWAINRSQDATITTKSYELRGIKNLLNYRYVLSENSYGQFDGAQIPDRAFSNEKRLNSFRDKKVQGDTINRWFLKYNHYYELPEGWVNRTQLNNASDLQYPKDFPLETGNNGDSAMENRISFTKNSEDYHFGLDSSYYVNLLQADPLASNNSVHRMPEVRAASSWKRVGKSDFLYGFDVNSTQFTRADYAWDDMNAAYSATGKNDRHLNAIDPSRPNDTLSSNPTSACLSGNWSNYPQCRYWRDGTFDSNQDLIRTGQRTDGQASIMHPVSVGRLDLVPKLTYRETQYRFNVGSDTTNVRRYVRTDLGTRTSFSQVFGDDSANKIKHEIVPEVTATNIPWINQPRHVFFGPTEGAETPYFSQDNISDSDLNGPYGLQFDYNDRVVERKLITFAITNKFVEKRKTVNGVGSDYRQFITWRIAQSYDAYQAESNLPNKQPYSDIVSDLNVNMDYLQIYQHSNYYPYQKVTNSSTRTRFINYKNDFIELGYLTSYNISPGQEAGDRKEEASVAVKKSVKYLDLIGRLAYDLNPPSKPNDTKRPEVSSYGYGAQIRMPGECWYFTIIQYKAAGGDNNFRFSFDFSFDGQKKAGMADSTLDMFGF